MELYHAGPEMKRENVPGRPLGEKLFAPFIKYPLFFREKRRMIGKMPLDIVGKERNGGK